MAPWSYTGDSKDASAAFAKLVSACHCFCRDTLHRRRRAQDFMAFPPENTPYRMFG